RRAALGADRPGRVGNHGVGRLPAWHPHRVGARALRRPPRPRPRGRPAAHPHPRRLGGRGRRRRQLAIDLPGGHAGPLLIAGRLDEPPRRGAWGWTATAASPRRRRARSSAGPPEPPSPRGAVTSICNRVQPQATTDLTPLRTYLRSLRGFNAKAASLP